MNRKRRIAIGGSAANPPHLGHLKLLEHLVQSEMFQKIIWLPSGTRKEKPDFVATEHRANMTTLTFAQLDRNGSQTGIDIMFTDIYGKNHPTIWWLEKIQSENPDAEVAWYTGVDSVVPEERYSGKCEIEACWFRGAELMWNWNFLIIPRGGFPDPRILNFPKHFEILDVYDLPDIRSSDIRNRIVSGAPFEHLVVPAVAEYIKENGLYVYKQLKKRGGKDDNCN